MFLCFSFCLSPFFYLVILEKKKALSYLESRAGWGRTCAGEWQARRAETRLCHFPGHQAGTGRPQTRVGRGEHLLPLPSPVFAPGASTQRSRGSSCDALLLPGWTSPGSGPRVHWPGAQRGGVPHSALPRGHAPSPRSILAVEARQLKESDVSPGKRLVPRP